MLHFFGLPITGAGFGVDVGATDVVLADEVDQLAVLVVKGNVVFFGLIDIGVVKFTNSPSAKTRGTLVHCLNVNRAPNTVPG